MWNPTAGDPLFASQPRPASTLYLVNSVGGRYAVASVAAEGNLVDWSPDGTRALYNRSYSAGSALLEIDLVTGETRPVTGSGVVGYAESTGHEMSTFGGSAQTSRVLQAPSGGDVIGSSPGLTVLSRDGQTHRELPAPAGYPTCRPIGWWETETIAATCIGSTSSRIWAFPFSGGPPIALTPDVPSTSGTYESLIRVPSGTYLTRFTGGCSSTQLERLNADQTMEPVTVPLPADLTKLYCSPVPIGGDGSVLILEHVGCDYSNSVLSFDTQTSHTTVLLGQGLNGGDIIRAIAFGSYR